MRLTALLRGVLRSEGEFTTLGRELEIVEAYLDIERARFDSGCASRSTSHQRFATCGAAAAAPAAGRKRRQARHRRRNRAAAR